MGDYVLGILGIIVSVGLFLIGYRQTVGAKRERVINANAEVERILVRRVVLESFNPSTSDINRLLEGKARDFRVRVGDLYSDTQLLTNIYTRILESDFIPQSQREEILNRLSPALEYAESKPLQEEEIDNIPSSRQYFLTKTLMPIIMAMMASILGGLTAVFPELGKVDINTAELYPLLIGVTLFSFITITAIILYKRIKDSQESTVLSSRSKILKEYLDFEKQVIETFRSMGAKISPANFGDRSYDFEININRKKILVEVKSTSGYLPIALTGKIVEELSDAVKKEGADEGLLVVSRAIDVPEEITKEVPVKILTLRQLKNYF